MARPPSRPKAPGTSKGKAIRSTRPKPPAPQPDGPELELYEAREPEIVELRHAGKWLAWSADGMRIVAVAEKLDDAYALAAQAGEPEPILERAPGRYRR